MRPLGAIAFAILAGLAAWLAVANRDSVIFSFDALHPGASGAAIRIPVFGVLLLGGLIGLVVGALYMTAPVTRLKRELRAEQARVGRLQRLLADETLVKQQTGANPPLSRISD
ncbi:MAG: hypothetical protein IT548_14135 [Alphaproteobacteria bacterium]|nr:hypothetical protein [Alphaproteobacteria bacterium]